MFKSMTAAVQRARYAAKAGLFTSAALFGTMASAQAMSGAPDPLPERVSADPGAGVDVATGACAPRLITQHET